MHRTWQKIPVRLLRRSLSLESFTPVPDIKATSVLKEILPKICIKNRKAYGVEEKWKPENGNHSPWTHVTCYLPDCLPEILKCLKIHWKCLRVANDQKSQTDFLRGSSFVSRLRWKNRNSNGMGLRFKKSCS